MLTFVCLYDKVSFIGNENKQMWFASLTFVTYVTGKEVVHMIESILFQIIYLLLFGLIAETICVFALIIQVIILSK